VNNELTNHDLRSPAPIFFNTEAAKNAETAEKDSKARQSAQNKSLQAARAKPTN
jgi:hypothetical protein